jgi:hypothetical protein
MYSSLAVLVRHARRVALALLLVSMPLGASAQRMTMEGITDPGLAYSRSWVDVNNDGKDDFCVFSGGSAQSVKCHLSDGIRFATTPTVFSVGGYAKKRFWWTDVNGDGQVDLCRADGTPDYNRASSRMYPWNAIASITVSCKTGPSFASTPIPLVLPLYSDATYCPHFDSSCEPPALSGAYQDSAMYFADVNLDNRADFCYLHKDADGVTKSLRCYLMTDTGFAPPASTHIRAISVEGLENFPRGFFDVNGDGYPDFCRISSGIHCLLGSANGFASTATMDVTLPGFSDEGAAFIDINGDGNTDLCRMQESPHHLQCRLSTGKSWESADRASVTFTAASADNKPSRWWADVNGDGLPDFCRAFGDNANVGDEIYRSSMRCRLTRGGDATNGLFAPQEIEFDAGTTNAIDFGRIDGGRTFCDPFGTGIQTLCRATFRKTAVGEVCYEGDSGPYCYQSLANVHGIAAGFYGGVEVTSTAKDQIQARPSLIGSFSDGLGADTRITYMPMSNEQTYAKSGVGNGFPRTQIVQPRSAVVHETRAWRTGTNVTLTGNARYFYKDLRVDNLRGSLGFRERWFLTEGTNTIEYTQYYQGLGSTVDTSSQAGDVREVGQAKDKRVYAIDPSQIPSSISGWTTPPGNPRQVKLALTMRQATSLPSAMSTAAVSPPTQSSPFMLLKRTTSTLGETTNEAGTASAPNPRFRPVVATRTESWDWNDRTAVGLPVVEGSSKTSFNGNALELTETTTDGPLVWRKETTNTYAQDNVGEWILGRLTHAKVKSSSPTVAAQLAATPASYGTSPNANTTSMPASTTVTLTPPSFAATPAGQSSTATATLSNNAGYPVVITPPTASSVTGQGLSFVSTSCGAQLATSSSCTVTLQFAPTAAGSVPGKVSIDTASGPRVASFDASSTTPVTTATLTSAAPNLGSVWYGAAAPATSVSIRNDGNVAMTLTGLSGLSARFQLTANTCTSIAPTSSCSMTLSMPTNAAGSTPSTVTTVGATNNASFWINGTVNSAVSRWSATSLAFGSVYVGQTKTLSLTLHNDGFGQPFNWSAALVNLPTGFTANTSSCSSVAPGASCMVSITFSPTAVQSYSGSNIRPGSVSYTANVLSVSGTGASTNVTLTTSPATTLAFGTLNQETWKTLVLTITNTGAFAATGLTYTRTYTGPSYQSLYGTFTVAYGTCPAAGGSLAPGASCNLQVTYTTTCNSGSRNANLTIAGTNLTAAKTVTLTGYTTNNNNCGQ